MNSQPFPFNPWHTKVIIDHPAPKVQLAASVTVSDEFRKEMNDWLASFFGYTDPVQRGKALDLGNGFFVVHPADYGELQRCIRRGPVLDSYFNLFPTKSTER